MFHVTIGVLVQVLDNVISFYPLQCDICQSRNIKESILNMRKSKLGNMFHVTRRCLNDKVYENIMSFNMTHCNICQARNVKESILNMRNILSPNSGTCSMSPGGVSMIKYWTM